MSWDTTAVENGGVTDAGKISAAEWNIMVDAITYSGYDYKIYKSGSNYYARKSTDGSIVNSGSVLVTVLNAVSADVSLYGAAVISFAGDTTYTFANSTVTFTDRQVYIDGSSATFNVSASNCSVFFWTNDNFTGHMRGGIRNAQLIGDRTNTGQIFASFYNTTADVYNLTTRNREDRAVYTMVSIKNAGVHSCIKDCYIYGTYPIRFIGETGVAGEASRTLIDHCHLGLSDSNRSPIAIEMDYGQNVCISHCHFTSTVTAIYGRNMSETRIQNCGLTNYTGRGIDIESTYAVISDNIFANDESSTTDITLWSAQGGIIADNVFQINNDDITTILANDARRLNITGNDYCILGAQSNCSFIHQNEIATYSNWWNVGNNNIIGSGVQTGVCMLFEDIRNSNIYGNNIGCSDAVDAGRGSIPWSEENIRILSERNTIAERYSTASDTYTAVMGEFIEANATGGAFTVTFPLYHTFQGKRTAITVKKTDSSANAVTLEGAGSNTLDGALNYALTSQNDSATFESNGLNWYLTSSVSF